MSFSVRPESARSRMRKRSRGVAITSPWTSSFSMRSASTGSGAVARALVGGGAVLGADAFQCATDFFRRGAVRLQAADFGERGGEAALPVVLQRQHVEAAVQRFLLGLAFTHLGASEGRIIAAGQRPQTFVQHVAPQLAFEQQPRAGHRVGQALFVVLAAEAEADVGGQIGLRRAPAHFEATPQVLVWTGARAAVRASMPSRSRRCR